MIPAGSQSPHSMRTVRVWVKITRASIPVRPRASGDPEPRRSAVPLLDSRFRGNERRETGAPTGSPRRHAQRAVKPDHFAVEIAVADAVHDQRGEFARLAEAFW